VTTTPKDALLDAIVQFIGGQDLLDRDEVRAALELEHVATVAAAPVIVAANHLSYADANVIEILLQRSGRAAADLADRLTALA
jgi:hypothetical protein